MKIVITAAKRTAIGGFLGTLQDVSPVVLGSTVATAVLSGHELNDVADVIVGNVLQAGNGMNVGRQIALDSGLPQSVPGQTINRVCGSGLQAVVSAVQALKSGDGSLYLAGGTESMSGAPYLLLKGRNGYRLGNGELADSLVWDGLTDPTHRYHMGITAENVAESANVSRADQDAFALLSQQRAAAANQAGAFRDEIVPVEVPSRKGSTTFAVDEHVRIETTLEALARLKPAFKPGGTVTAGNASGLNDGAAMVCVTTEEYARGHGLQVLAEIVSYATVGVNPAKMGIGPAFAIPKALKRAGLTIEDIQLFELNEAFAAQSVAVVRALGISTDVVNVRGGAIAMGHPIGASGARVLVTLIHALRSLKKEHGLASLCIGGGMGIAVVLRAY